MNRLEAIRKERGLSQDQLAALAGMTRQAIGLLERDLRMPRIQNAYAIAAALGVTVQDIWPKVDPDAQDPAP